MNLRIFVRGSTIILLLLLSIYFVQHPLFERFDISEYEGDIIPLYFIKIADSSEGGYVVEAGISGERAEVITDVHFKTGDIVSFYGPVKNNRLIAQKYHRHKYPNMVYYLSVAGLVGFLWLMKKEGD
ncbi:MAG: hypothetical protein V3R93_05600 [Candidatus Hydrothermarchaeaceae archaeon]